jgi:NitT/TauT family transport system permease protein
MNMTVEEEVIEPSVRSGARATGGVASARLRSAGPVIATFFVFIGVWYVAIYVFNIPQYLLPAPHQIAAQFQNPQIFIHHGTVTLIEAVVGFFIGTGIGFALAVILDSSSLVERGFMPYLIASTNIPVVAIAPVIVLWFGFGMESKIAVAAFLTFFPVVIYTLKGLKSADPVLRDLFYANSATRSETFWKLRFPSALPYIFTALKVGATTSVLAAVVAEFIQASQGLGYLILFSSYNNNLTRVWAAVFVSSAIAIVFYSLVVLVERWAIPWHASMRGDDR